MIQTTQGLLRYLQYDLQHSMSPLAVPRGGWQLQAEDTPFSPSKDDCAAGAQLLRQRGVCIGYDHRQRGTLSSETFALLAAAVFLSQGVGPIQLASCIEDFRAIRSRRFALEHGCATMDCRCV